MKMPNLSSAANRMRPAVFADLQARIDALTGKGVELFPFQIGDTFLPPPRAAREAMRALDGEDASLFRYGPTAGMPELREAMASISGAHGVPADPTTEILLGNGGTHALFCASRAILDEGDEVLVASPYWPLSPGIFTACGARVVEVAIAPAGANEEPIDVAAAFAAKIGPRTRAIYFSSPGNPDGRVLDPHELEALAVLAQRHDLWVLSDEVYADTLFDEGAVHRSIAALDGMRERTLVLRSLSKSHALAGCRIGFAVAPAPVVAAARRISVHSAFNTPVALQRVALAALQDRAFPVQARDLYARTRAAVLGALTALGLSFRAPRGATYVFVDFAPILRETAPAGERPLRAELIALLERAVDHGVLLTPGGSFGEVWQTHARICFTSVPHDDVLRGVARLGEAIAAYRARPLDR